MTPAWDRSVTLEAEECMRLLSSARLGRVGLNTADGTDGEVVAFEVDELDDRMRSGWSVLVIGRAEHVEGQADVSEAFGRLDQPWAPGPRPLVARIVPSRVTGRRFTSGAPSSLER